MRKRKRQHVRVLIQPAMQPVQLADNLVVCDHRADMSAAHLRFGLQHRSNDDPHPIRLDEPNELVEYLDVDLELAQLIEEPPPYSMLVIVSLRAQLFRI